MILPLFVGCDNSSSGDDTTTEGVPEETTTEDAADETTTEAVPEDTEPDKEQLVLIESKATEYKLVIAENATHYVTDAANEFASSVNTKYGTTFEICKDTVENLAEGQLFESDAKEILVGATNRKESQDVLATLKDNEYTVRVVGNKLVIVGKNDYLSSLALRDFEEKELADDNAEKLYVDIDFSYVGKNTANTIGDTDATIRVMTFNVYGKEAQYLKRIQDILKIVKKYNPDVVCLQECNKEQHSNFVQMLTVMNNYAVATDKHPNSTTYVYTPILYRKDKLELVDASAEWLDSRYTKTNTKSLAWAVLKTLDTKETFGVVNIHGSLWSDSYVLPEGKTHEDMHAIASAEWKPDNIRQMYDRTNAIIANHGNIPILWTGDYNFDLTHEAYKKATEEYNMHDAGFSATDAIDKDIFTWHPVGSRNDPNETRGSIDHIFGNDKVIFRVHNICDDTDEEVAASDHYAVFADVKLVS